jgi:hypothetical protein
MAQQDSSAAGSDRSTWAITSRVAAWVIFLGGLTGAGLGIAELRVEVTVAGLILACTTGLVLLRLRADSQQRGDA